MKQIKSTFLIAAIATGLMIGGAQQCKAAFYPTYYADYVYYQNLYHASGVSLYYYASIAYYYYYLAGYYGDYAGFYYDPYGYKSTNYRGSITYAEYYYNYYAYYGDYWARL